MNKFFKRFLYSLLIFLIYFYSSVSAQIINDCDRLASHPEDPNKISDGINWDEFTRFDEAIIACEDAVKNYPNEARYIFQLGRAHLKKENFQIAFNLFNEAASKNYSMANYLLGMMSYHEDGNLSEYSYDFTISNFEKAKEIEYLLTDIDFYIASTNYWNGYYDKAIEKFLIIEKNMQFSERNWVLVELGASYYSLGDYENSKIYLDKLLLKILLVSRNITIPMHIITMLMFYQNFLNIITKLLNMQKSI